MRRRPLANFIRRLRIEEPPDYLYDKLVKCFKDGGLGKFEDDVVVRLGDMSISQVTVTDPITRELLVWKYVGEGWWCRARKGGKGKFEFARAVAYVNKPGKKLNVIDGLWDVRRHSLKVDPVIVYCGDLRGVVQGFNEFEVYIAWFDRVSNELGLAIPIRSIDGLTFEFVEDHKKFSRIFSNIQRHV